MVVSLKLVAGPAAPRRPLSHPSNPGSLLERAAVLAGIGAWSCDLADDGLTWTHGVYELFGLPTNARLDRREMVTLYEEESRERMERLRATAIARGTPFTLEAQIVRPDGEHRWLRLSGDVVRRHGKPVQLYGLKQDITEERQRWDALRRRAEWDPLTGLSNRNVFQSRFLDRGAVPSDPSALGALVLLDIDGFKLINDNHGHAAGDACLEILGRRLALSFHGATLIARIGGDEFAVLMPPRKVGAPPLEAQVARTLTHLSAPIAWRGQILDLGVSAGIAEAEDAMQYDAEALFAAADAALYTAKRSGRNRLIAAHGTRMPSSRIPAMDRASGIA